MQIDTTKKSLVKQVSDHRIAVQTRDRSLRGFNDEDGYGDQGNHIKDTNKAWDLEGKIKCTRKQVPGRRLRAYDKYNVQSHISSKIEGDYMFMNQGWVGACSFMSLMNLYQFTGKPLPDWFTKLKNVRGVEQIYLKKLGLAWDGYGSFVSLAMSVSESGLGFTTWKDFLSHFKYEVFRGSQTRWNKGILGDATTVGEYDIKVRKWIEDRLDEGCIVAVPFVEHFACIIGYDDEHFLFLNSFGERHDQGGLSPMLLYSKLQVASYIEDCFFLPMSGFGSESSGGESKVSTPVRQVRRTRRSRRRRINGLTRALGQPAFW
jgi:hypothetical protein